MSRRYGGSAAHTKDSLVLDHGVGDAVQAVELYLAAAGAAAGAAGQPSAGGGAGPDGEPPVGGGEQLARTQSAEDRAIMAAVEVSLADS